MHARQLELMVSTSIGGLKSLELVVLLKYKLNKLDNTL